jgi:hypothetical protein
MELSRLADVLGAEFLTAPEGAHPDIAHVFASDRMSDLLDAVTDDTLLVTNLANVMLNRAIELMDVPAICLLNGVTPENGLLDAARSHGTAVIVSPHPMYETCGRIYAALAGASTGMP